MPLLSDALQLIAGPPSGVMNATTQIVGPNGLATYYYWIVTHYPIGAVITGPFLARRAPSPLSTTNYVLITADRAAGATTYDILRTNSARLPSSGTANIAVAIGLTLPTFLDQGGALSPFNLTGLPNGSPATNEMFLNNRDFDTPTLVVSPFPLGIVSLRFPDGSMQSSAAGSGGGIVGPPVTVIGNIPTWSSNTGSSLSEGYTPSTASLGSTSLLVTNATGKIDPSFFIIDPAQIYSWQQNVVGNGFTLTSVSAITTGINGVTVRNSTTGGWQIRTTSTGHFVITNAATGAGNPNRFYITQGFGGDVVIGTGTFTGVDTIDLKPARLQIYMPTNNTNPNIPMIYAFNAFSNSIITAETGDTSGNSNALLNLITPIRSWQITNNAGLLNVLDITAGLSRMVINGSGQVGIGTSPAHLLQLGTDDAAKPTTNTWTIVSDIRTKRNVRPLEGGLSVIDSLVPTVSEYNGCAGTPEGERVVSLEPEKVRDLIPHAVRSHRSKLNADDKEETELLGLNTHEIFYHLLLAVQQLNQRLSKLETVTSKGSVDPMAKPSGRLRH